jgi:hypothetical protein
MVHFRGCLARLVLSVLLVAFGIGSASAQQAGHPVRQELPRYACNFNKAPWAKVLAWLTEITELPVIASNMPTGSFTFVPPSIGGMEMTYTVPEIIDILNESLFTQQYMIVRRRASIMVWSADEPFDPILLPRLTLDDLPNYGNTEVVKIGFQPQGVSVESLAAVVKEMISPYGQAFAIKEKNLLDVLDKAGNLRGMIGFLEGRLDPTTCPLWAHRCLHSQAAAVADQVERFLSNLLLPRRARAVDVIVAVEEATNTLVVSGPPDMVSRIMMLVENREACGRAKRP